MRYLEGHGLRVIGKGELRVIGKGEWPPSSPDLNPIENVWAIIEAKVKSSKVTTLWGLKIFVMQEWTNFNMLTLQALFDGYSARLNRVIEAGGGHI